MNRIIEGECSGILNWNEIRMSDMYKLYKVLLLNHWIADEIPMSKDASQFAQSDPEEQRTFKVNISACGTGLHADHVWRRETLFHRFLAGSDLGDHRTTGSYTQPILFLCPILHRRRPGAEGNF